MIIAVNLEAIVEQNDLSSIVMSLLYCYQISKLVGRIFMAMRSVEDTWKYF